MTLLAHFHCSLPVHVSHIIIFIVSVFVWIKPFIPEAVSAVFFKAVVSTDKTA
jgi:hypothetical protein